MSSSFRDYVVLYEMDIYGPIVVDLCGSYVCKCVRVYASVCKCNCKCKQMYVHVCQCMSKLCV